MVYIGDMVKRKTWYNVFEKGGGTFMANLYDNFTNLYSVPKTLRFELIPQGKTLEWIKQKGFIQKDKKRAKDYQKIKKVIDKYHKNFIEKSLRALSLSGLEDYLNAYLKEDKKTQEKIEESLKKQIVKNFNNFEEYKLLTASTPKDLLKEMAQNNEDEEERETAAFFDGFATYFTGYQTNRKNMYGMEDNSISYRIVNENLPKFISNINAFKKIKQSDLVNEFPKIAKDLEIVLQANTIEEVFEIDYFNFVLSQKGIEGYNNVIGGIKEEKNQIFGLNNYINQYNQTHSKEKRLPKLQPLFKQILSDVETLSFVIDKFESDKDVYEALEFFANKERKKTIQRQYETIKNINQFNPCGIYILSNDLTNLSQQIFSDYSVLTQAVSNQYDKEKSEKERQKNNYEKKRSNELKKIESFSLGYLQCGLNELEGNDLNIIENLRNKSDELYDDLQESMNVLEKFLNSKRPDEGKLIQDEDSVAIIKNVLDKVLLWFKFNEQLMGTKQELDRDVSFYGEYETAQDEISIIVALYNKCRNYLTQKPYKTEKFKLNFDNGTLLEGWDANKETANLGVMFIKDGKYFLGIMDKKHNKILQDLEEDNEADCYQKVVYKLLPGPNKMLPKVFFSKARIDYFNPSNKILDIKKNETFKKGENFSIDDCRSLIDFYKESIEKHEDWKNFSFKFDKTDNYNDISNFFRQVEKQGYKISFKNINKDYIEQQVEEGNLYLFQIYNKDFSEHSTGTPNLHTLYWKALFDPANLDNVIYKLNGQAEIFYRPKSLEEKVTHKANEPIDRKTEPKGNKKSKFVYDLYKDKRFMEDKFQFHVPITMNFNEKGLSGINPSINKAIKEEPTEDIRIIGIDRGERHLLYYSLINSKGQILEQGSLNKINGTDYHELLNKKEEERLAARKNWKTINNIKELKEGYLSQVVYKLTQLMRKHNAILVLENLNSGFKNSRKKVEKQVYQNFEKAMIDKTNYLVDKNIESTELGGLLNALQLTNKFESFKKLGKQNGVMFYVNPWNTSKIDPTTGFVNLFYGQLKSNQSIKKIKEFFNKFEGIIYNSQEDYFEFTFDYNYFGNWYEGTKTKWTVCTNGERIREFRNKEKNMKWDTETIDLTERLKNLFAKHGIDFKQKDIKEQVISYSESSRELFDTLMYLFKLTLQMRNSIPNTKTDYMISPVKDENGEFFCSGKVPSLPDNADANGAYNIARKGLILVNKIKDMSDEEIDKLKSKELDVSNEEWLKFAQGIE